MEQGIGEAFVEEELWVTLDELRQLASERDAVLGQEHFGALLFELGSVDADPDAIYFRARLPEGDVLFEIAGAFEHGARDDPVDIDLAAFDVFEDALVGGGLAADVVVGGKTVNGDGHADARQFHPFWRNGDDGAGDDQREDVYFAEGGENTGKFAMTDQRLAADERNVEGLVFVHEREDAIDEGVTVEIAELAESDTAAEVLFAIGVTAGAAQGAFARDFDREQGDTAGEDASPGGE